jgi:hypothetical protein
MKRQIIILLLAGVLAGCHSTRPAAICEPEIVPKPYPLPVFVGVVIPELPPMELPPFPTPPPADADEEVYKDFVHRIGEVSKERAAIRDARIRALLLQIEANNKFATEHPAPTPSSTPTPPPE